MPTQKELDLKVADRLENLASYLATCDSIANIRRRQDIHAKELAADGKGNVEYDNNETCWQTGIYQDGCVCEFCHHKDECSASGQEDD